MTGRLDANTTGRLWRDAQHILEQSNPIWVVIDASEVSYCDGAGVAFIVTLQQYQARIGSDVTIHGLREEFRRLLDIYGQISLDPPPGRRREPLSVVEQVGHAALGLWQDVQTLLTFVGELTVTLLRAARYPRLVRWPDAWLSAERVGVDALPIIALIGFLLGLILAFQSAIPMRRFGAEIFVANLIGVSMLREMGPLITAIILAGRSGSAFAAELGTEGQGRNRRPDHDGARTSSVSRRPSRPGGRDHDPALGRVREPVRADRRRAGHAVAGVSARHVCESDLVRSDGRRPSWRAVQIPGLRHCGGRDRLPARSADDDRPERGRSIGHECSRERDCADRDCGWRICGRLLCPGAVTPMNYTRTRHEPIIQVQHVTAAYEDSVVIDDISFEGLSR